jgi:hypothetical protein
MEIHQIDARTRERLRNWRASGSPEEQAQVIREAIRSGRLDYKKVQLCAFLGHTASRLVADDVKPRGIVINNKLLSNEEIGDLAQGLTYFGRDVGLRINLAMARMAFASPETNATNSFGYPIYQRGYPEVLANSRNGWILPKKFSLSYTGEIEIPGVDVFEWFKVATQALNGCRESHKKLINIDSAERYRLWNSYYHLPEVVMNLVHESFCENRVRPKVLKYCNGHYKDETILSFLRMEMYTWALGEFYEDTTSPPDFIAYHPFVSRRRPNNATSREGT